MSVTDGIRQTLPRLSQFGLATAFLGCAVAQAPPGTPAASRFRPSAPRVVEDQSLQGAWTVAGTKLYEDYAQVSGAVTVRNLSPSAVEDAKFYAEYFDKDGRLCMTLGFAIWAGEPPGPVPPGGQREVVSISSSVMPASRPVEVKVSLVSQRPLGQSAAAVKGEGVMHGPVNAAGPDMKWQKLTLDPALLQGDKPIVDLVLADLSLDAQGKVAGSTILNAASADLRSWFPEFLQHVHFDPATLGSAPIPAETLMLVRALNARSLADVDSAVMPARASPWVQAFAASYTRGDELPQVIGVHFFHPADAPPNEFDGAFAGAEWGGLVWRPDPNSHTLTRRWASPKELRGNP
jgi:hypothetical protein